MKYITRKLRLEAQIAEKGYLEQEDVLQYTECCVEYTQLFKSIFERISLEDLRKRMYNGYKLPYTTFKEKEIEFLEDLKNNHSSLFKIIMEL